MIRDRAISTPPTRRWWRFAGVLSLLALVTLWRRARRPSNDRHWSPEYARIPWFEIKGDEITIHNFRHCDYRAETDFTVSWETKTVRLSNLRGVDLFMSYWGSPHIAHTLLSFDFGAEGRVCNSIETRRELGETYSAGRGFFRHYELCHVVGDERDLIRVRTNYRTNEDVYLYPLLKGDPGTYRALFLSYVRTANHLRVHPRWYNAATNNCTTNMQVIARASGYASAWDWRILLSGHLDGLLYQRGIIPSPLPFAETKIRARINERARNAGRAEDFSEQIRAGLAPSA